MQIAWQVNRDSDISGSSPGRSPVEPLSILRQPPHSAAKMLKNVHGPHLKRLHSPRPWSSSDRPSSLGATSWAIADLSHAQRFLFRAVQCDRMIGAMKSTVSVANRLAIALAWPSGVKLLRTSLKSAFSANSSNATCLPLAASTASISTASCPLLTGPVRTAVAMFKPGDTSFTKVILGSSNNSAPACPAALRPKCLTSCRQSWACKVPFKLSPTPGLRLLATSGRISTGATVTLG